MLDLSKFKEFADGNSNLDKMAIFVCDRKENIAGKGENAGNFIFLLLPAFSTFPIMFSKCLSFSGSLKVKIVW